MRFKERTRVSEYKWGQSLINITNNDIQIFFFLLTGDPGRAALDPDLQGKMVKIEWGSNLINQIFNFIARYVQKVHADEHICRAIHYSAWRSFLDVIGPSDILYIISMIKNSKGMCVSIFLHGISMLWLSICSQEGILYFKFPERFLEISWISAHRAVVFKFQTCRINILELTIQQN